MNISNINIRWAPTERAGNSEAIILLGITLKQEGQTFWSSSLSIDMNELSTKNELMEIISFGSPGPVVDSIDISAVGQLHTHDVLVNGTTVVGQISPDSPSYQFSPRKFPWAALALVGGLLGFVLWRKK